MGLNLKRFMRASFVPSFLLAGVMALNAPTAMAQPSPPAGGQGGGGTGDTYVYNRISNNYLTLYVGAGSAVAGSFGIWTNASNATDPSNAIVYGGPIQPTDSPVAVPYFGGWLYVRIDDGTTGSLNGKDYLFGDSADGGWLVAPTRVGNHIEARWATKAFSSGTGSSSGTTTAKDVVEIDMVGSFIHDTVRFSFTVKNTAGNAAHKIGLAFVEDLGVQVNTLDLDGPLRLTNSPYLHTESLLTGGQIPSSFSTYVPISAATTTSSAKYHSIKAILQPTSSIATEPTQPTRFAYGRTALLEGSDYSSGSKKRNYDWLWNFAKYMDPTVVLDKNVGLNSTDASTVVYWDQEVYASGENKTKVAYIGSDTATTDYSGIASLSVSGPPALGFVTDRTNPSSPVAVAAPNPFVVTAAVQNLTDVYSGTANNPYGFDTTTFTINLPPGLVLAAGETATKTVASIPAGTEGTVSWNVQLDASNPQSGTLLYAVSASTNSVSKVIQRTVQVPAPTTVTLDPDAMHPGYFKMKSFGLLFNSATPSAALGLPQGTNITPQIDTRSWDPSVGHYAENPNWTPGFAYWVRYNPTSPAITTPQTFSINAALYPPLDQQVQPTATSYKVSYSKGWNQIGNPYVYDYRFSEIQVFNPSTLTVTDITTASDNIHQWILPAVYHYNTGDPSPSNWKYDLEPNMGFTMAAGEGYWIYVLKDNLQFIYNGVDTPGASVSRSAQVGVGLGSTLGRALPNNWRVNLVSKSAHGTDTLTYVGVAPNATDTRDIYKYGKPPAFNPSTSLDIVHSDWGADSGRYAQDLRSPSLTTKVWNLEVSAPAADNQVTITWPGIASSLPRNYDLYLVDPSTNVQHSLRDMSSYTVAVTSGTSRSLQLIAQPRNGRNTVAITSFDVVGNNTRATGAPAAVTIRYTLTNSADTQINVRDSRGRVVRTLNTSTTRAADGSQSNVGEVVWDLKDQKGVNISSGSYNVELVAVTSAGQRSRQIKPYTVVR